MPTLHACVECAHAEWRECPLYFSGFLAGQMWSGVFQKPTVIDVLWCRLKNREVLPFEPACKDFRPKGEKEGRAKMRFNP